MFTRGPQGEPGVLTVDARDPGAIGEGGEQARVQLARTLAQLWDVRAGLLLVDEPTASLDAANRRVVINVL